MGAPGWGSRDQNSGQEPQCWASLAAETKDIWKTFALVSKRGQVRTFWEEITENAYKLTYKIGNQTPDCTAWRSLDFRLRDPEAPCAVPSPTFRVSRPSERAHYREDSVRTPEPVREQGGGGRQTLSSRVAPYIVSGNMGPFPCSSSPPTLWETQ